MNKEMDKEIGWHLTISINDLYTLTNYIKTLELAYK